GTREGMTKPSAGGAPATTPRRHSSPAYPPLGLGPLTGIGAPATIRLGLQRRAAANLRSHVLRAMRRFTDLLVADLASFYLMRELVRAVRDLAVFGEALADPLQAALPRGILNGWQYAAALFVALFVTGNY